LSLLGQDFAYKHVDLRASAHKKPEYLAINRFGQEPALVDGDLKLCQSGSILLYLADKSARWATRRLRRRPGCASGCSGSSIALRPTFIGRAPQARLHEGR
jgi:glutathione S-transferase